ncbi:hypothetical protein [Kitasatospora sp. NPDC056181]
MSVGLFDLPSHARGEIRFAANELVFLRTGDEAWQTAWPCHQM